MKRRRSPKSGDVNLENEKKRRKRRKRRIGVGGGKSKIRRGL